MGPVVPQEQIDTYLDTINQQINAVTKSDPKLFKVLCASQKNSIEYHDLSLPEEGTVPAENGTYASFDGRMLSESDDEEIAKAVLGRPYTLVVNETANDKFLFECSFDLNFKM